MKGTPFSLVPVEEKSQWDAVILKLAPHALFQSWEWGEVEKRLGTKIWRLAVLQNSKVLGVLMVAKVKAKRGTFLHVRHGPVLATYTSQVLSFITEQLAALARAESAWFVRMSPLISLDQAHLFRDVQFRPAPIHAMNAEYCWVLDLSLPDDVILANMRKSTRYDIKRAKQLGVAVSTSEASTDLAAFFSLYEQTSSRHGFVPHSGVWEEFGVFTKEHKALLFTAVHEKQALASAIVLFYGNQGIYHHGASLSSKVPASSYLQWHAIQEAKKRGMTTYNFWGIAPEGNTRHPWTGITGFKKGFGGEAREYMHAQDYPVSPFYVVPFVVDSLRRIQRGY